MSLTVLWTGFISSFLIYVVGVVGAVRHFGRGNDEAARIAWLRAATERNERRRLKAVKRTARALRKDVIEGLSRIGFCWIYERQGAMAKASRVIIREVLYSQDALWLKISRMPFGKRLIDLDDPDVMRELSAQIEENRECRFILSTDVGGWIQIDLKSGLLAIPRYFPWYDKKTAQNAVEMLPKTKSWDVAVGMRENRQFVYQDARDFPHLLVAGATGGGKSVFLNQMLCSMISRNPPNRLEIVLIDLKGGLEFYPYREIPHLRSPVVVRPDAVPDALAGILAEKERRFTLLRRAGVRDIRAWNQVKANKMPYIFVFFDEIATLMLNPKLKRHVETLVSDLTAQGRALGLHMVLCTQVPNRDVLSTLIRGNITTRVVFNTDSTGSMIALGNGSAAKLPPGGRMVYKQASWMSECQAPYISETDVQRVISGLLAPDAPVEATITAQWMFEQAIEHLNGKFSQRAILETLSGVTRPFWEMVAAQYNYDYEERGPIIAAHGSHWILAMVPVRGGRTNWLLNVVPADPPADEAAVDDLWAFQKMAMGEREQGGPGKRVEAETAVMPGD